MWYYGSEEAFTVIHNFLVTGLLAVAVSLCIIIWSIGFVHYVTWVLGQWIIGHFHNDWLLANGYSIIVMVLGSLMLTVISAYAYDLRRAMEAG